MTGPEYVYGGNGIEGRYEYSVPRGEALEQAFTNVVLVLETIFEHSQWAPNTMHSFNIEEGIVKRFVSLTYTEYIPLRDAFISYDIEAGGVQHWAALDTTAEHTVNISHEAHNDDITRERYYIIFGNTHVDSQNNIVSFYQLEIDYGGFIEASVTYNDLSAEVDKPQIFQRDLMSVYDFESLQKRLSEVESHVEAAILDK